MRPAFTFRRSIVRMLLKALGVLALLYLLVIRYFLFELLGPYYNVVTIAIKFSAFILALDILNDLLKYFYRRRFDLAPGQHDNITLGLNNIYLILVIMASLATVIALFGINPKELFTSLSIVAAGIAIVSKEYFMDIISGMYIAFSREVVIDDQVQIGEHTGKVLDISIAKIALLNEDDDILYIPNHKFFNSDVINYSKSPVRKATVEFEIELQSMTTLEELQKELENALLDYQDYIAPDSFNLRIVKIYKDYLSLKFQYDLNVQDRGMERDIRKKTVRRVVNFIREHGGHQASQSA